MIDTDARQTAVMERNTPGVIVTETGISLDWASEALRITGGGISGSYAMWLNHQYGLHGTDRIALTEDEQVASFGYSAPTLLRARRELFDAGLLIHVGKQGRTPILMRSFPTSGS